MPCIVAGAQVCLNMSTARFSESSSAYVSMGTWLVVWVLYYACVVHVKKESRTPKNLRVAKERTDLPTRKI